MAASCSSAAALSAAAMSAASAFACASLEPASGCADPAFPAIFACVSCATCCAASARSASTRWRSSSFFAAASSAASAVAARASSFFSSCSATLSASFFASASSAAACLFSLFSLHWSYCSGVMCAGMPLAVGLPPLHVHLFDGQFGGAPDAVSVATGLQFSMHHASLISFLSSSTARQSFTGFANSAGAFTSVPAIGSPPGHSHRSGGQYGMSASQFFVHHLSSTVASPLMAVQPFARLGSAASVAKRACLADVYAAAPVSVVASHTEAMPVAAARRARGPPRGRGDHKSQLRPW